MKIKTRRYFLYYLAKPSLAVFSYLPLFVSRPLAAWLGGMAYFLLRKYRRVAINNLIRAFPDKDKRKIEKTAQKVFVNLALSAVEAANFRYLSAGKLLKVVRVEGQNYLDSALKNGKGVIILTGHLGNWELMPAYFSAKGYHGAVVGRRIYFYKYDKLLNRIRNRRNVAVIYRDESPKKMLRVLKNNGILGMLADQDVDSVDGIFVKFFGKKAYTPSGPAKLAMASGAPIIPGAILRIPTGYKIVLKEPIFFDKKLPKDQELYHGLEKWSGILESLILNNPEQWVWIHERWKTQ